MLSQHGQATVCHTLLLLVHTHTGNRQLYDINIIKAAHTFFSRVILVKIKNSHQTGFVGSAVRQAATLLQKSDVAASASSTIKHAQFETLDRDVDAVTEVKTVNSK